ncbi:MAG: hypothetical protein U0797_09670 [Gemmataceae bacterium]
MPWLIDALGHKDARVRAMAARTLGKAGPRPEGGAAAAGCSGPRRGGRAAVRGRQGRDGWLAGGGVIPAVRPPGQARRLLRLVTSKVGREAAQRLATTTRSSYLRRARYSAR